MQKPFSVRNQPWSDFNKQSYRIFTDDFIHDKLLSIKTHHNSNRGSVILKGEVVAQKNNKYHSNANVQLWFPLWLNKNQTLFFKSKDGKIKIQYDHGLNELTKGKFDIYNFYASYQAKNNFNLSILKTGINLLAKTFSFDNRIRIVLQNNRHANISTGHKINWANDKWSIDYYELFDWKHLAFIQNGLRIGFRHDDNDIFLRCVNNTQRRIKQFQYKNLDSYFTNFTVDFVRKVNNLSRIGIQTQFTKSAIGKSSFVFQRSRQGKQQGVKAKVSTDRSVAICYQSVIEDYGKWTVGCEISGFGKKIQSKYGIQFDVNL